MVNRSSAHTPLQPPGARLSHWLLRPMRFTYHADLTFATRLPARRSLRNLLPRSFQAAQSQAVSPGLAPQRAGPRPPAKPAGLRQVAGPWTPALLFISSPKTTPTSRGASVLARGDLQAGAEEQCGEGRRAPWAESSDWQVGLYPPRPRALGKKDQLVSTASPNSLLGIHSPTRSTTASRHPASLAKSTLRAQHHKPCSLPSHQLLAPADLPQDGGHRHPHSGVHLGVLP